MTRMGTSPTSAASASSLSLSLSLSSSSSTSASSSSSASSFLSTYPSSTSGVKRKHKSDKKNTWGMSGSGGLAKSLLSSTGMFLDFGQTSMTRPKSTPEIIKKAESKAKALETDRSPLPAPVSTSPKFNQRTPTPSVFSVSTASTPRRPSSTVTMSEGSGTPSPVPFEPSTPHQVYSPSSSRNASISSIISTPPPPPPTLTRRSTAAEYYPSTPTPSIDIDPLNALFPSGATAQAWFEPAALTAELDKVELHAYDSVTDADLEAFVRAGKISQSTFKYLMDMKVEVSRPNAPEQVKEMYQRTRIATIRSAMD